MTYQEKLKDPRWQKKRLEILERDGWRCICGNSKDTLHVHHKYYMNNKDPWDYNNDILVTLCESCHQMTHISDSDVSQFLLKAIRKKFSLEDISIISLGFHEMKPIEEKDFLPMTIYRLLKDPATQQELYHKYFNIRQGEHKDASA